MSAPTSDPTRSWYASRKFQLAAFILVLANPVLLYLGLIDSSQWVDVTKWVFGLYCTGNVASKVTENLTLLPKERSS